LPFTRHSIASRTPSPSGSRASTVASIGSPGRGFSGISVTAAIVGARLSERSSTGTAAPIERPLGWGASSPPQAERPDATNAATGRIHNARTIIVPPLVQRPSAGCGELRGASRSRAGRARQ
jgi:hypothetical protein